MPKVQAKLRPVRVFPKMSSKVGPSLLAPKSKWKRKKAIQGDYDIQL